MESRKGNCPPLNKHKAVTMCEKEETTAAFLQ